jgi:hypothetical protein
VEQNIDLSILVKDTPVTKITVSGIDIYIKIFFSFSCCKMMFKYHEEGDDYRLAFIKTIYHMYQNTTNNKSIDLTIEDFIKISDDNLLIILENILVQDIKVKTEYDKIESESPFEHFYNANEAILAETTKHISDSIGRISKKIELLNKPLLKSIDSAMSSIIVPEMNFHRMTSLVENIPKFNLPQWQSALINLPRTNYPEIISVIKNLPKPVFDIQEIVFPFQSMVKSLQLVNENLIKMLQSPLFEMTKNMESLFSSIDFSLLIYRKEWNEQRETLLKYGWFYSGEFPDDLIDEIHEKRETLTGENVDEIIVTYFRNDRCKALKDIVKQWKELPYFCNREIIFHEALVNHSRKYYNSSVTLLTVHTEGVITDFVRLNLEMPRYRVEKAIKDIKIALDENEIVSIYEYEVFNDVIERIEDAFTEGFKHSDPDKSSNKSRHKIAHGHAYEKESEVNSLKKFLYLNEIYHLFLLLNKQT